MPAARGIVAWPRNALRHTLSGGRVEIGARIAGAHLVVSVRDTGPGLTADQAARVFDRFYRAEPSRSRDGGWSGLGPTIARTVVAAMGGAIAVAGQGQGLGTTFAVRLPLADAGALTSMS